jgi:hypothetical protein
VTATINTMSSGQVAALAQDPAFQHAFVTQTMQTLGTTNPLDPRVVSAWDNATKKANQGWQLQEQMLLTGGAAPAARGDLDYPGKAAADPTKTELSISFAGKDLKLPGLPAYLQNTPGVNPNIDLNGVSDFLGGAVQFGQSLLQQGQAVGVKPQPGATTPTPTVTVNPNSMAAPTPVTVASMPTSTTPTSPQIATIIGGGGSGGTAGSSSGGSSGNAGNMA